MSVSHPILRLVRPRTCTQVPVIDALKARLKWTTNPRFISAFISYFSIAGIGGGSIQDRPSYGYSLANAENDVMRVPLVNRNSRCVSLLGARRTRTLPYLLVKSVFARVCVCVYDTHLWQRDFWRFCDSCRWILVARIHRPRRWTMPRFESCTRNGEHLIYLRHIKFRYELCVCVCAIY